MHEPTIEEIKKAINEADDEQVDLLMSLENNKINDSDAVRIASAYGITYDEMLIIDEWVKYVFLGLTPVTHAVDSLLVSTHSDEDSVTAYLLNTVDKIPLSLRSKIKKLLINQDVDSEIPGFFDGLQDSYQLSLQSQLNRETSTILSNLTKVGRPEDIQETQISKDDILAGIENPTETVKTPSFALPKSKPQTTKILSSIAQPADPTMAIIDPLIKISTQSSVEDVAVEKIVDPFMSTIGNGFQSVITSNTSSQNLAQSTPIYTSTSASATTTTITSPAQKIIQNMDEKLQKVQSTAPTEIYKVAETPRHDPYREVPGL